MRNKTLCSIILVTSMFVPLKKITLEKYRYDVGADGRIETIVIESKRKKELDSYWNSIGIYFGGDKYNRFGYRIDKRIPLKMFCWWGEQLTEKDIELKDGKICVQNRMIYQREDGKYDWKTR